MTENDSRFACLIAIVGTNASGKSHLAVDLATYFDGEVISADSRQVYRGLDIGSGKLTPDEMRGIPHHLVNVAHPNTVFSLAEYQRMAYSAIEDILGRRKLPFLVGGTGLYVSSVTEGYRLPNVPPNQRLREQLALQESKELWSMLAAVDADAAKAIDRNNKRRIIRALELHESGTRYTVQAARSRRYPVLKLGLTWPVDVLRERIHARLIARIKEGMINEVSQLLDAGISRDRLDSFGLEYRHVLYYLEERYGTEGELVELLERDIYRFSRKQMIWFRKDAEIHWLDPFRDYNADAVDLIASFLKHLPQ